MKTIRRGVFETNSSSTHSITIMSEEDYDLWGDEWLLNTETDKLVHKDSVTEDDDDYHIQTKEGFFDTNLETDENYYTTKSGDNIIVICKYGYDS